MSLRPALLLALLIGLAACASEPEAPSAPPPTQDRADAASAVPDPEPVAPDALVADSVGAIETRDPGEVLNLDTAYLTRATAERNGELYGVARQEPGGAWRALDGGAVDEGAVEAWLGRLAPLEAEGRFEGVASRAVTDDPTHRLVFQFSDGSARSLALQRRGDRLAAVASVGGPVFQLPASMLPNLVPPPATLRAE